MRGILGRVNLLMAKSRNNKQEKFRKLKDFNITKKDNFYWVVL